MSYYHLSARLLSALMVQENRQTNTPRGLPYLPGSSLRGAVAAQYLRTGGRPGDDGFRNIFLEDPVSFPDLLPCKGSEQSVKPLPTTVLTCKRAPGFIRAGGHGFRDSLALHAAAEIQGHPLNAGVVCQNCQHELIPATGFWNGEVADPERFEPVLVYQPHTGIDRHTGAVAASNFYITQGIAGSCKGSDGELCRQYLAGGLFLDENQHEILSKIFSEPIFAGADRTRGMGEMQISLKKATPPELDLESWDNDFRKKLGQLTDKEIPSGLYFSLGFASHAIFVDRFLRPSLEVPLDLPGLTLVTAVIRKHRVRGWQSSWHLPKPEDTAIGRGSVYLFRYTGDELQGLKDLLKNLVICGAGLRRAEGFGRVTVSDPAHVQEVM